MYENQIGTDGLEHFADALRTNKVSIYLFTLWFFKGLIIITFIKLNIYNVESLSRSRCQDLIWFSVENVYSASFESIADVINSWYSLDFSRRRLRNVTQFIWFLFIDP